MTEYRTETDSLGDRLVPKDALYGIHTLRAMENFPLAGRPVHPRLIHAYGLVKLACARTNQALGALPADVAESVVKACQELAAGDLDQWVPVDSLQGGAGTSTNMNINEVIANRGLLLAGRAAGDYDAISPHAHVNLHQSTNDTYPTALRVAAIGAVRDLEQALVALIESLQRKEQALAHVVKVGRTQLQDAVLTTLGRSMGAFAEAFGRDRWRVYKCEERLRVVNLGGTAIGTGLAAPREYIFRVVDTLREVTGFGLVRAENLVEATQNADVFVEVSGILKACATNLLKSASDLRLMASGPEAGLGELRLPARQAGSSIMPHKVNPVIPEAVSQAALRVLGNDSVIAHAVSLGQLELNAFLPVVADALLEGLDLLTRSCGVIREHCIEGLEVDEQRCKTHVSSSTATFTALVGRIGYEQAELLATRTGATGETIREAVLAAGLLTGEEFDALVAPEAVCRLGSPRSES